MSTLSAVVLSYNKAWVFDRFHASLDRQTRPPDQVIVVDDASTDGMQTRLPSLPASWAVVRSATNEGQSRARNVGFEHATGDHLIFLDGDIEMAPDMLSVLEEALERDPGASIAYGHYARAGSRLDHVHAIAWDAAVLRHRNYISTISLVRRTHLPRPPFDPELRRYEDWDLWIRMSQSGARGVFVDRVLFTAHYRPGDLSGTGESLAWYHRVLDKHSLRALVVE